MHINDVLGVIEFEDLRDCILVGHSYGGMVATGVADRVPERIQHVIYLDAFVPGNGQSLFDLRGPAPRRPATSSNEDWLVPPNPSPPDTRQSDLAWLAPRRRPQPVKTFSQTLQLRNPTPTFPRSYIYCTRKEPGDVFLQFSARFKSDPAWRYFEIAASHSPNVTAPEALVKLFCEIVVGQTGRFDEPSASQATHRDQPSSRRAN
jgi:pimeloyl-ACP methyl ester carboxylesterase